MSNDKLEKLLLLAQTDELSDAQRKELDALLEKTASARALRDDMDALLTAVRETPLPRNVDPTVLRRIEIQGRRELTGPARNAQTSFLRLWRPAIASGIAAILLLSLGIRYIGQNQGPPDFAGIPELDRTEYAWDIEDEEVDDLYNLLALAVGGIEDAGIDGDEELLRELLSLEGLNI